MSLQTANSFGYIRAYLNKNFTSMLDEQGYIFIDRDPSIFKVLLQSIRSYSRPLQRFINENKQHLLCECDFVCVDTWLIDLIKGNIGGFFMRVEDRKIRFDENNMDLGVFNPFDCDFKPRLTLELGPILLQKKHQIRITCGNVETLKERLDILTNGLITELAFIQGLLIAGGCIVHALTNESSINKNDFSDIDIFLIGSPSEGLQKIRYIHEAIRKVCRTITLNASVKKLFVTRTSGSITFFITDKSCPPIQVVIFLFIILFFIVFLVELCR